MARKTTKAVLTATFIGDDGKVLQNSTDANWLLITPVGATETIEVGNRDHSMCNSALSFFTDAYRFGKYDHPLTDYAKGVHVYASIGDAKYADDAATIKLNGKWYMGRYYKPNGEAWLDMGAELDPVDRSAEIVLRMQDNGSDIFKQEQARGREQKRAKWHADRIKKHTWGAFYGFAVKVWIAHERKLGAHYAAMINEPDNEKASKMRNDKIDDRVTYDTFIAPIKREARREAAHKTDEPDFESNESSDDGEQEAPAILMPFVNGGVVTDTKVDLRKLAVGVPIFLYIQKKGNGVKSTPTQGTWDPTNEVLVREWIGYAANPIFSVGFAKQFLPK